MYSHVQNKRRLSLIWGNVKLTCINNLQTTNILSLYKLEEIITKIIIKHALPLLHYRVLNCADLSGRQGVVQATSRQATALWPEVVRPDGTAVLCGAPPPPRPGPQEEVL